MATTKEEHKFLKLMKDLIEYNSYDYDDETVPEVKKHNYDALREIFCDIGFVDEQGNEVKGIK